jgi:hypothetical protein
MKRLLIALVAVLLFATACDVQDMIVTPKDGAISSGPTVEVTGKLPAGSTAGGTLKVNGATVPVNGDGTWSTNVARAAGYTTDITVIYTNPNGTTEFRQRRAVVNGPNVADGEFSPDGVGLRFTNTGLDNLGPVIDQLAGGAFDIGSLLLARNPLIDVKDAFLTFDVKGNAYEAGIGGASVDASSTATGVKTRVTVEDLYIGVNLNLNDGLAINTNCSLELQLPQVIIDNTFDLRPAADPNFVDVNLVGSPSVNAGTVNYEFISGICDGDVFLIGDIVNALAGGQIQSLIADGFSSQLGDPDGAGPADSPIADAIETALAEISIAGSVGEAVKVNLNAPFTAINETASAIDFRANADFFSTIGAGPTDCPAVANAPDLGGTYGGSGAFPTLGDTTPAGDPYGLGLTVSSSAFNQLLGSLTECGLLNQEISTISLGGPEVPLTSSVLAALIPAFATALPANTPMKIRVVPTSGPYLTDAAGPNGEPGELVLGNLLLQFIEPRAGVGDIEWLTLAVDAPLGFDLAVDPVTEQLAPAISAPPGSAVTTRVVRNNVNAVEPPIEAIFSSLFPSFVSSLGSSFAAFPLPSFLGLKLDVKQVARSGNYWILYSDLLPVEQTRLENVAITDLSSADSVVDSVFDVNEWRHRIRPTVGATSVGVDFKGMLGADACCTVDDEQRSATAAYRVSMDVIPANGESWKLDLSHLIRGAHTLIDEKVALEDAGGESRFQTAVTGRVRVGNGAWQNFNVNPSVMSVVHGLYGGEGTTNREFTGSAATSVTGSTAQTVTVEFSVNLFVKSNSNAFFPAAGGDEVALRFGANDTIANGFTAGTYPGLGNRSLLNDGWKSTIVLTPIP